MLGPNLLVMTFSSRNKNFQKQKAIFGYFEDLKTLCPNLLGVVFYFFEIRIVLLF